MNNYSPRGSLWNRWDLHFHTPASFDYLEGGATSKQLVDKLVASGIRVVAITDHHVMDIAMIQEMQKLGGDRLTVLPGIELRSDQGGKPIHYICIFPEDCDLTHVWGTLQGKLGLTAKGIQDSGGDQKVYVPIEKGADEAKKLGGVVSIHAGSKSNSIEEIKNKEQFQERIKFDITKYWIDIFEIGQIKDIDVHLNTIFPATNLERPLMICSDNHKISEYKVKTSLWLRADPTFRGLRMVLREPQGRVFIGDRPDELIRVEQNPTKYVRSVGFARKASTPIGEQWFNGQIEFNPGLVAIVGNKGSGKSALADTLGLLGASKNSEAFSFLSHRRFRRSTGGLAQHFDAIITWESDEKISRCLNETTPPTEMERLKYLPQDHVENVCNELTGSAETGFEKELKSVIFSHVPDSQRLNQTSLDDLVEFRTGEKQKRIDTLIRQIKESSRLRASLEARANPDAKLETEEKIKQRVLEIDAHDKAKPPTKNNPADEAGVVPADPELLKVVVAAESEKKALDAEIFETKEMLRIAERRLAVAKRLIERIDNFAKEFSVFSASLQQDATELGLKTSELASISVNKLQAEQIRDAALIAVVKATKALSPTEPNGLAAKHAVSVLKLADSQSKLDAPNRAYQVYLKELAEWQEKRNKLEGATDDADSLKGLQAMLVAFADLPEKIAKVREEQVALAVEIHQQKAEQAEVYRSLYQPVQDFIDTHDLAKDKLKLEFRAELTDEDFADRLLRLLALNRRGSFMGVDEGRKKVDRLVDSTKWDDVESVKSFLIAVDTALYADEREVPPIPVQLRDQLPKGKKTEDVLDLLFGLEYIQPRYILRWDGKDLEMLSPGERGTLLLVFYLLIDKGDMPLVIDQPEGNLDNHTVAKVLVHCIKAARKRRQVFIVTHNPNLAVVCDADQVVHASIDKTNGSLITYTSGSLENPAMSTHVTDVLEGTRWAFSVRGDKYDVGK